MKNKILMTATLIIASVLQVSYLNAQEKSERIRASNVRSFDAFTESGETELSFTEDGHRYKARVKGSKIIEMYLDGNKVAESDYGKYEPMIKTLLEQLERDRAQAEKDREQAAKDREQAAKDRLQAEKDRAQAEKDRVQAESDRKQAEKDREQAVKHRKQAVTDRESAQINRKQAEKQQEELQSHREQAEKDRQQASIAREQAAKDRVQAGKDREQAAIDRKTAEEDRKLMHELVAELVSTKLVENEDALTSFLLDDTELSVNGVKQSDDVHSKFKSKYLKSRNSKISFRKSHGFRGITTD